MSCKVLRPTLRLVVRLPERTGEFSFEQIVFYSVATALLIGLSNDYKKVIQYFVFMKFGRSRFNLIKE